ncbi:hypothetical protein RFI_28432 [Reticulomyxa filosa]|uniref:Uncharacterized protein n=1 Tax=Reticulomyxa filosa TaxID=46433 RepID=X6M7E9_RETFI|nr:hypothetical protein RFI_28432 [Reticulomyxa filosa]|eukprot:ETO08955.1 hypothetical protein RFI_28432 [Reticulomyxa filosa]
MEEIILILPFQNGIDWLLGYLMDILSCDQNEKGTIDKSRGDMEKCVKLCLCIVETRCLKTLSILCRQNLTDYKRTIGHNLETFAYLQDLIKSKEIKIYSLMFKKINWLKHGATKIMMLTKKWKCKIIQ